MPDSTAIQKKTVTRKTIEPVVNSLWVVFNLPLLQRQIEIFREALLHCLPGRDDNQVAGNKKINKDGQLTYSSAYPLMQFRCHRHRAAIFATGRAVPVLEKFLDLYCNPAAGKSRLFPMGGHSIQLSTMLREKENSFRVKRFNAKLKLKPVVYRLHTWLPFSKDNYENWWKPNRNKPDTEKTKKLEELLTGHLCAFLESQGGFIPRKKIKLSILDKDRLKKIYYKNEGQVAFDIRYTVNLHLPRHIGLGNHSAFGFGWQRQETD